MGNDPITFRAGINTQASPLLNENGWSSSNLVRFKDGMIQKLGGCIRLSNTPVIGTARGLHAFNDLSNNAYIGIGTNQRLMLYNVGQVYDITPQLAVHDLAGALSTVKGSKNVTITDAGYTPAVGDYVIIANLTYIGGLTLQGSYPVVSVGFGMFQINSGSYATSTANNTGATLNFTTMSGSATVTITLGAASFYTYQIINIPLATTVGGITLWGNYSVTVTSGVATIQAATPAASTASGSEDNGRTRVIYGLASAIDPTNIGYGLGPYGAGNYGEPLAGYNTLRQWSLDNWGQTLIGGYTGGPPYIWNPPIGPSAFDNPATLIAPNAYTGNYIPWTSTGMFVAMPERQLVIFGTDVTLVASSGSAVQDPLLVRFCDVSDYTSWYPTATNQAGSYRLPSGSRIVGGIQGPLQALLFTDIELWSMQYVQFPLVYGFTKLGIGCGLISLRSVAKVGPNIYWMSQQGWFLYDGSNVTPLRCTVWDVVFNSEITTGLDTNYLDNVFAAANSYFNEIAWYFPTIGSNGAITNYVKYNTLDNVWDYGSLVRTDWIDQSVIGAPVAVDGNGIIQQHEMDNDMDSQAMDSYALSAWFQLAEGSEFISLQRLLPDFVMLPGTTVTFTVQVAAYVNDSPVSYGPYTVNSTTEYIIVKARGRVCRIKVESTGHGAFWRLGKVERVMTPAGRR